MGFWETKGNSKHEMAGKADAEGSRNNNWVVA
jgi:hypothetical protein